MISSHDVCNSLPLFDCKLCSILFFPFKKIMVHIIKLYQMQMKTHKL